MPHRNPTDHPIHPLLADRWSPYVMDPRPMPMDDLRSLLEAARWAPSAYNEQPWRYLAAVRQDEQRFARLLSCLVEPNQAWAGNASALLLTVVCRHYRHNGKPNGTALHDVGLASAQLTVEAGHRGLVVHQMGGIQPDRARELYGIPAGFDPVTALAIGFAGTDPDNPALLERDQAPRSRRPLQETVFGDRWDEPLDLS